MSTFTAGAPAVDLEKRMVEAFKAWANRSVAPDEPCVVVGRRRLSPRQLAVEVAQGSEIGRRFVRSAERIAARYPAIGYDGLLDRVLRTQAA